MLKTFNFPVENKRRDEASGWSLSEKLSAVHWPKSKQIETTWGVRQQQMAAFSLPTSRGGNVALGLTVRVSRFACCDGTRPTDK